MNTGEASAQRAPVPLAGRAAAEAETFRGWRRALVWAIWCVLVTATLVLFISGVPGRVQTLLDPPAPIRAGLSDLGLSVTTYALYNIILEAIVAAHFFSVAGVIAWHKWRERLGLMTSLVLIMLGAAFSPAMYTQVTTDAVEATPVLALLLLTYAMLVGFFILFPDGEFNPGWTRWIAFSWMAWLGLSFLSTSLPVSLFALPLPVRLFLSVGWVGAALAVQVYKYTKVSDPIQRRQTRWVVFGFVTAITAAIAVNAPMAFVPAFRVPGRQEIFYVLARTTLTDIAILLIPLSIGISVLRYHLWDIDVIIGRALVYVPLSAIVAGLYAGGTTLFQKLFVAVTGEASDTAVVLTVLVMAAAFTPLKNGLQALVDRWFKPLPDPLGQVRLFCQQIEGGVWLVNSRQVAARALDVAVGAFHARGGAAYLALRGTSELVHSVGEWEQDPGTVVVPFRDGDDEVGSLVLGERHSTLPYRPKDLKALARMGEAVARAIRNGTPAA
jgi:hypothetical protein